MMNNENTMAASNNQKVTNAFDRAGDKKKKALIGVLIAAFYWIPCVPRTYLNKLQIRFYMVYYIGTKKVITKMFEK